MKSPWSSHEPEALCPDARPTASATEALAVGGTQLQWQMARSLACFNGPFIGILQEIYRDLWGNWWGDKGL